MSTNIIDVTRSYSMRSPNGAVTPVVLRFFGCEPVDQGASWHVAFTISGLDPKYESARSIYGVDGLQAFLNAMRVARAVLESDASYREGLLSLQNAPPSAGLGLDL